MLRDGEYHLTVVTIQHQVRLGAHHRPSTRLPSRIARSDSKSLSGPNFVEKRHVLNRLLRDACRSDRLQHASA
jgi:hypothetical protein